MCCQGSISHIDEETGGRRGPVGSRMRFQHAGGLSTVARDAIRAPISGEVCCRLNSHDCCSPHMGMLGMASSARPRPKPGGRWRIEQPQVWLHGPSHRLFRGIRWSGSMESGLDCRGGGLVEGNMVVSCPQSPDDRVRDLGGASPPRRMRDAGGDARCQPNPVPHTASLAALLFPFVDDWRILRIWAVARMIPPTTTWSCTNPMRLDSGHAGPCV